MVKSCGRAHQFILRYIKIGYNYSDSKLFFRPFALPEQKRRASPGHSVEHGLNTSDATHTTSKCPEVNSVSVSPVGAFNRTYGIILVLVLTTFQAQRVYGMSEKCLILLNIFLDWHGAALYKRRVQPTILALIVVESIFCNRLDKNREENQ